MNQIRHQGEAPWKGIVPAGKGMTSLGSPLNRGAPPACAWAGGCRWEGRDLKEHGYRALCLACVPIRGDKGQTVRAQGVWCPSSRCLKGETEARGSGGVGTDLGAHRRSDTEKAWAASHLMCVVA